MVDDIMLGQGLMELWPSLRAKPSTGDPRRPPGFGWSKREDKTTNAVIVPDAANGSGLTAHSVGYWYIIRTQGTTARQSSSSSSSSSSSTHEQWARLIFKVAQQLLLGKKMVLPEGITSLTTLFSPERVASLRKSKTVWRKRKQVHRSPHLIPRRSAH